MVKRTYRHGKVEQMWFYTHCCISLTHHVDKPTCWVIKQASASIRDDELRKLIAWMKRQKHAVKDLP
jgi:hypothetical protein